MAVLGQWTGSAVSVFPGTTWAAPASLFPTEDRNDSSVYTFTASTSTLTLPSSGLADGYLLVASVEVEVSHNNRAQPMGRFQQTGGTGTFVTAEVGGYCRDNSEDRAYLKTWAFVDGPSASATFQFEWIRDTGDGTPAGACPRATLQVIPFYYSDIGLYTSTNTGLYGGTTPNQVTGWSGTDGTNITLSSEVISVTGDNTRYLILGSQAREGTGNTRTQRWHGLEIDGTFDDAAKTCVMYRNTNNDNSGGMYTRMIETATATRTIEHNTYLGAGVTAGLGGADVDGGTPTAAAHACVVIELNSSAEVWSSTDETGAQEIALTGPVDINVSQTADVEFNDSASFTRASDTGVNATVAMDALVLANVSHAREASSIGSGLRWTVHGAVTVDGVEQTDLFHGNYNRGNQGTADAHGSSINLLDFVALSADEDVGVSNTELSGTEGGNGDIETQPGWVSLGIINLDTLEAGAATITDSPTPGALVLTGVAPTGKGVSGHWRISASGNVTASGEDTTAQLTAPAGKNTGDFDAGRLQDDENPTDSITISSQDYTEVEFTLEALPGSTYDETYEFWLEDNDGTVFGSYTLYPTITVEEDTGQQTITDSPTEGALTLTGLAPTTRTVVVDRPTAGALTLTGFAPLDSTVVPQATITDSPTPGALVLTGVAPTTRAWVRDNPTAGSLVLTGVAPVTRTRVLDSPTPGTLTLTGFAPTTREVSTTVVDSPTPGQLTLTGIAPVTRQRGTLVDSPTPGALTLTGFAPSASQVGAITDQIPMGILSLVGSAPRTRTVDLTFVPLEGGGYPIGDGKRKRTHRTDPWPRKVKIDGRIYTVRNEHELRQLLYRVKREQETKLATEENKTGTFSRKKKIKVLRGKISRLETRTRDVEAEIRAQEEELILLLA